jgi:hypothetical protein
MVRGYLECVSKVIYRSTYIGIVFRSLTFETSKFHPSTSKFIVITTSTMLRQLIFHHEALSMQKKTSELEKDRTFPTLFPPKRVRKLRSWVLLSSVHVPKKVPSARRKNIRPNKPIGAAPGRDYYLICVCSSKEDGTYFNQFSRYFTTLYGMIHHKKGGTLRRGYRLKEQEMTM